MGAKRPLPERFWEKVDKTSGPEACWLWRGGTGTHGYGVINIGKRIIDVTHRVCWKLVNGDIPPNKKVLHRCDNRLCVNPVHLFLGDDKVNLKDMTMKDRHGPGVKITTSDAIEIKKLLAQGTLSGMEIASLYGLDQSSICDIKAGRTWMHAKEGALPPSQELP